MAKKIGARQRGQAPFGFLFAPAARHVLGEAGLDLVDDRRKTGFVDNRHVGEHLAVDLDRCLFQAGNEGRIRHALLTHRRVDAGDPERAEHALALAPVAVGVLARLHHRFLGNAEHTLPALREALRLAQYLFVPRTRGYTTFYPRHRVAPLRVRHHAPHRLHVGRMQLDRPAQMALGLGGLLGKDVALERLATFDRTAVADDEALGCALFRLHLGHGALLSFLYAGRRPLPGLRSPPSLVLRTALLDDARLQLKHYFFFFGANTITIWRPSSLGIASTWLNASRSVRTRSSTLSPRSWCAISRPRKRIVTFALSPSSRNSCSLRTFVA